MKTIRKAISVFLAGVIAAVSMFTGAVSTSAAEGGELKLLTASVRSLNDTAVSAESIGQDLYYVKLEEGQALYRVDKSAVDEWRNTGILKGKRVYVDATIAAHYWEFLPEGKLTNGIYGTVKVTYKNGNESKYVVKYNEKASKLECIFTSKNPFGVSSDGYISEFLYNSKTNEFTVKVWKPDFRSEDCIFSYYRSEGQMVPFVYGGKYALLTYNNALGMKVKGKVYLIGQNAERYLIYDKSNIIDPFLGANYAAYEHPPITSVSVRRFDKSVTYTMHKSATINGTRGHKLSVCDLGERIFGNIGIAKYKYELSEDTVEYCYALVDLEKDKLLTGALEEITSKDGKIFRVKGFSGSYAYFNPKGEKLSGGYSGLGDFAKDSPVAPVMKDGRIYLVDRNMKTVSGSIAAGDEGTTVRTLADGLYAYTSGGIDRFITYRGTLSSSSSGSKKPGATTLSVKKNGKEYTFTWDAVDNVKRYQIFWTTDDGKTKTRLVNVSGKKTTYTMKVKERDNIKFAIRAVREDGGKKYNGKLSDWVSA